MMLETPLQRAVVVALLIWASVPFSFSDVSPIGLTVALAFIILPRVIETRTVITDNQQIFVAVTCFAVATGVTTVSVNTDATIWIYIPAIIVLLVLLTMHMTLPLQQKMVINVVLSTMLLAFITLTASENVDDTVYIVTSVFVLASIIFEVSGHQQPNFTTSVQPLNVATTHGHQPAMTLPIVQPDVRTTLSDLDEVQQNIDTVSTVVQQQVDQAARQSNLIDQMLLLQKNLGEGLQNVQQRLFSVAKTMQQVLEQSANGQQAVQVAMKEMTTTHEAVLVVGESITQLASDLRRAGNIVTSVSDISTQSNFLALNAQIEAARAGEQGRGFSIVADEVRDLADQSRQATLTMKRILRSIQSASMRALSITESTTSGVNEGVRQAEQLQRSVNEMDEAIRESNKDINATLSELQQFEQYTAQLLQQSRQLNQAVMQNQASMLMAQNLSENAHNLILQLQTE